MILTLVAALATLVCAETMVRLPGCKVATAPPAATMEGV